MIFFQEKSQIGRMLIPFDVLWPAMEASCMMPCFEKVFCLALVQRWRQIPNRSGLCPPKSCNPPQTTIKAIQAMSTIMKLNFSTNVFRITVSIPLSLRLWAPSTLMSYPYRTLQQSGALYKQAQNRLTYHPQQQFQLPKQVSWQDISLFDTIHWTYQDLGEYTLAVLSCHSCPGRA